MLTRFGFTDYENRVYETLHHAGKPMTGYALAKDSGVPRGKIYPCTVIWRKRGRIGVSFI